MPIVSAVLGSSAVSKAKNAEVAAGNNALSSINQAYNNGVDVINSYGGMANTQLANVNAAEQTNTNPYQQLGIAGANTVTNALNNPFSFDPTKIAQNPDYQFQLQQGTQAVQRAAAANGTLNSGGTLKALDQFSQGLASNEIGQAYNQALSTYQTNLGAGQQAVGAGLGATTLSNAAYQNYGNLSSQNTVDAARQIAGLNEFNAKESVPVYLGQGNAVAAGAIGQGNIWGGFVNNVANNAAKAFADLKAGG